MLVCVCGMDISSLLLARNIFSSELVSGTCDFLVDCKTSRQLCVCPPFFKNLPLGGGFGADVDGDGGLNGSFFSASIFGLPGLEPPNPPPTVICLIFKGLPNLGDPADEPDRLLCRGGT